MHSYSASPDVSRQRKPQQYVPLSIETVHARMHHKSDAEVGNQWQTQSQQGFLPASELINIDEYQDALPLAMQKSRPLPPPPLTMPDHPAYNSSDEDESYFQAIRSPRSRVGGPRSPQKSSQSPGSKRSSHPSEYYQQADRSEHYVNSDVADDDAIDPLDFIYREYRTMHDTDLEHVAKLKIGSPDFAKMDANTFISPEDYLQVDPMRSLTREIRPVLPSKNATFAARTRQAHHSQTSNSLPLRKRSSLLHSHTTSDLDMLSLSPINGSKLSSTNYEQCCNVWSRQAVFQWLSSYAHTDADFVQCCIGLFTHHVPTLANPQAERLAFDLRNSFVTQGELSRGTVLTYAQDAGQGVLPLLTGSGCYSTSHDDGNRCYSCRCSRTLPIKRSRPIMSDDRDWAQFWGLKPDTEPMSLLQKTEIQRQYQLHELIYSETDYVQDLKTFRDVFEESLQLYNDDPVLRNLVFGRLPTLEEHAKSLECKLRERQSSQGPIVHMLGDIFIAWIERAGEVYVEYAKQMCYADSAIRVQKLLNPTIAQWLTHCNSDPRVKKLDFFSFHGAPTRRLQRYVLLLSDVLKKSQGWPDCEDLQRAIDNIKAVCISCDLEVEVASNQIKLRDLADRLVWRITPRNLELSEPGREVRFRGQLQRKSEAQTQWQTREVVLLDNFLLCIKNDGSVVSKPPIPLDYLVIEDYEEVLYKSSSTRLIGGTITRHGEPSPGIKESLYPLTFRHVGRGEEMTFYADSKKQRTDWIHAVEQSKIDRWQKNNHKEPFHVHILSENFGAYIEYRVAGAYHAVGAACERREARPKPIVISRIHSATTMHDKLLIGTDDGVYNDRTRLLQTPKVTQIAALDEFGVLLVLSDKTLLAFNPISDRPPQKLSKDVAFFEVGKMKDRTLVIYKRRQHNNSVFHVLEPVIGKKHERADFFRDFDQFYLPVDCYGIQFLKSVICIRCSKGFQIMSLDSKQPEAVPSDATSISDTVNRPLGVFRYGDEFVCSYAECSVFVDKFGNLSRKDALVWEGLALQAFLQGRYLIGIGKEFVEVWDIEDRRLRQIITGKDIRLINNNRVILAMAHPSRPAGQLVFELVCK